MIRDIGPTQKKILQCLVARCEYGYSPILRTIAVDAGVHPRNHGLVLRALHRLETLGLVEKNEKQWRPTNLGVSLISKDEG